MHARTMANHEWIRGSEVYDMYVKGLNEGKSLHQMHKSNIAQLEKKLEDEKKADPYWHINYCNPCNFNHMIDWLETDILLAEHAFFCLAIDEQLGS